MNLVPYMRSLQKLDVTFTVTYRLGSVRRSGNKLVAVIGSDYGGIRKERIVDQIVDPMTGATLGVEKAEIGRAVVSSVADKYSRADYSATLTPEPGDVLTFESRQFDQPGGEPGAR